MYQRCLIGGLILVSNCTAGCQNKMVEHEGVWVIVEQPDPEWDVALVVVDNFSNADAPNDDVEVQPDWSNEIVIEVSELFGFVQIIAGDTKDEAYMLMNQRIYPGSGGDDGWTFTREFNSRTDGSDLHESGYYYASTVNAATTITINLSLDDDSEVLSGSIKSETTETVREEESDEWDDPADWPTSIPALPDGGTIDFISIPTLTEGVDGNPADAVNYRDRVDCTSDCFVEVTTTTTSHSDITLEKTSLEVDALAFEGDLFQEE